MKKRNFGFSPLLYYCIVCLMAALVMGYLVLTLRSFSAFAVHQDFISTTKKTSAEIDSSQIMTAITYEVNPGYYHTLGTYLYRSALETGPVESRKSYQQRLDEAEKWLKKAVLTDPANPWHYYELGRVSYSQGDCGEDHCPFIRYFLAAFRNAPKDLFLRTQVSRWYYYYDREAASQFIREIIAGDEGIMIQEPRKDLSFARSLYEIGMDYESDLEATKVLYPSQEMSEECIPNVISPDISHGEMLEIGNDDGVAEWKVHLVSKNSRIKKVFCLPEHLEAYHSAALKIFMNRSGTTGFDVTIQINEHLIPVAGRTLPYVPKWHEIPFDIHLLEGQTKIHVYLRAESPAPGGYLQVWGDQETPNSRSTFNFQQTEDLSADKGPQTGEYLIRLVLR